MARSPDPAPPPELPPLRDVMRRHGLSPSKALGQHFLLDLNLTGRIARAAGDLTRSNVIEIGPGPGGLTRALLGHGAAKVFAVEKDARCVRALAGLAAHFPHRLTVIEGDALKIDIAGLAPKPRCVVANLPFNISTALLLNWLPRIGEFTALTLMFQKEVAGRLCAKPGGKAYGRLSVITQWLCEVRAEFDVSPRAFQPPPKVAATVVTLLPRREPLAAAAWRDLETVTAAAFGQRRKMLRTSLKPLELEIESLGIDPRRRAEELSVEEFCALARALGRSRSS